MNFWEWRSKKADTEAPKIPRYKSADKHREPEVPGEPMVVEESTASDSMIVKALKFWKGKED